MQSSLTMPLVDERMIYRRERALAKARKVRARQVEARRRHIERGRQRFAEWVKLEHAAHDAHAADPTSVLLRHAWLRVLKEMPPLYGRKESAA